MKKLVCIIFVLTFCSALNAQDLKEADVPAIVKTNFISMYPNAKNVRWEKEHGNYEAEMGKGMDEISVIFNDRGTLIQTETEISVSELPKGVSEYTSQNLRSKKINEATKILSNSGIITYEAEIGNADFLFDADGKFIKKNSDSNENDNNDNN